MAVVRGQQGALLGMIGTIPEMRGEYLSWFASRAIVGVKADTVIVLTLSEGVITAWVSPYVVPVWTDTLPHYFRPPVVREEVWQWPWIEYGGEIPNVVGVSSVAAAAVGGDGTIVAVRNRSAEWRRTSMPNSRINGRWAVVYQTLESYSPRGELLARFQMPSGEVRWLSMDKDNRVFIRVGEEVLIVNLAAPSSRCAPFPATVSINIADAPPPAGELVVGDGSGARPTMAASSR
jgi:hypothetical protein